MPNVALQTVDSWRQLFVDSFTKAFGEIIAWAPSVVAMLLVLVIGYVVARVVGRVATAIADRIGLQTAAERGGLVASMKHIGIDRGVPAIVGSIVFWLLMCVFLTAAFNILGLPTVTTAMEQIVSFIPKLLVATVVVVIGLLVASFLRGVIAAGADRLGLTYAERLANGFYYLLALMTFIGAFEQLDIKFAMLEQLVLMAFGAVALGFGLAFGLGGREVMGGILAGYYTRQRLQSGDRVSVAGMEGTVREVGPVATIIETDEDGLLNRHSVPNTKMLTDAVR